MIVYDGGAAPGEPTYLNGAAARAHGLETGLTATLAAGVRASASYTYLDTEATDDAGMPSPTFAAGDRLIRRPKHSAEFAVRARLLDRVLLGGSVTYVGRRDDGLRINSPASGSSCRGMRWWTWPERWSCYAGRHRRLLECLVVARVAENLFGSAVRPGGRFRRSRAGGLRRSAVPLLTPTGGRDRVLRSFRHDDIPKPGPAGGGSQSLPARSRVRRPRPRSRPRKSQGCGPECQRRHS